jgi:hypothetical protein
VCINWASHLARMDRRPAGPPGAHGRKRRHARLSIDPSTAAGRARSPFREIATQPSMADGSIGSIRRLLQVHRRARRELVDRSAAGLAQVGWQARRRSGGRVPFRPRRRLDQSQPGDTGARRNFDGRTATLSVECPAWRRLVGRYFARADSSSSFAQSYSGVR